MSLPSEDGFPGAWSPVPWQPPADLVRIHLDDTPAAEQSLRDLQALPGKVVFCKQADNYFAIKEEDASSLMSCGQQLLQGNAARLQAKSAHNEVGRRLGELFPGEAGKRLRGQMTNFGCRQAVEATALASQLDDDIHQRAERLHAFLLRRKAEKMLPQTYDRCAGYVTKVSEDYRSEKINYTEAKARLHYVQKQYDRHTWRLPSHFWRPITSLHLENRVTSLMRRATSWLCATWENLRHPAFRESDGWILGLPIKDLSSTEVRKRETAVWVIGLLRKHLGQAEVREIVDAGLANRRTKNSALKWRNNPDLHRFAKHLLNQARVINGVYALATRLSGLQTRYGTGLHKDAIKLLQRRAHEVSYLPTPKIQADEIRSINEEAEAIERQLSGTPTESKP